ncbi:MAG TPA: GTPase [Allosphingosinicella sp.]|nr:GTPase [Allosphingosinicella sp.]
MYHAYAHARAEAEASLGKVNVIVAGNAGVGKSTLVNAVFGKHVALTGVGRSQTQGIDEYSFPDLPLRLYDTRGFEIGDSAATVGAVHEKINDLRASTEPHAQIHVAWPCILEQSHRIEPVLTDLLNMLDRQSVPAVVVVTQALGDDEMVAKVRELAVPNRGVVPLLALEKRIGPHLIPAYGVSELIDVTLALLPDAQTAAFVAAQRARWDLKEKAAVAAINEAVAMAVASAGVPVPGGHSVALVGIQAWMIAQINARIGIRMRDSGGKDMVKAMAGMILTRFGGQTAFGYALSEALRFFPGLGSIGAAMIGGPIAGALTKIFGHLYLDSIKGYVQSDSPPPSPEALAERMKALLEQNRDRYSALKE